MWLEDDDALLRARLAVGSFDLTVCSDGPFRLDGGAMFGVVPKVLWSRRVQADERNCIQLGLNTVVVRTGQAVVVIETGVGHKLPEKLKAIFDVKERLPQSLAAAGVRVEEVTHVVNTHLHFDHCGWNTRLDDAGHAVPMFPNARYFAPAEELAHGRLQLERDRVSYLGPNYDPLIAGGQLTVIDPGGAGGFARGDARLRDAEGVLPPVDVTTSVEIVPGVWVEPFPGHTESMLGVHIESGSEHACYIADLMPTRHHVDTTWGMGYDLDPLRVIEEKKKFLRRALEGNWHVLLTHDHEAPVVRVREKADGKGLELMEGRGF